MYGLVFAGGGARGAYQIGVWKALREMNIDIDIVTGTSVGALNGALFAQNRFDDAYEMWNNMSMSTVFRDEHGTFEMIDKIYRDGLKEANFETAKKLYNHITKNKGLNVDPLRELIEKYLDEDLLASSGIEYGLVTVNITEKKPQKIYASELDKNELKYYVLGSALFPGFNQDKNHSTKFFDGGLIDNMPIKMVKEKGYKDIIAVNLRNTRKPNYKDINLTYICPSEPLGSILHFNQENAQKNISLGYLDALKVFNKLQGNKYFFTNVPTEKELITSFINLNNEDREIICNYLGIQINYSDRYLFEKVIPKFSAKLGLKKKEGYLDLLYGLLELLMKQKEYDRLLVYNFGEILTSLLSITDVTKEQKIYQTILKVIH